MHIRLEIRDAMINDLDSRIPRRNHSLASWFLGYTTLQLTELKVQSLGSRCPTLS